MNRRELLFKIGLFSIIAGGVKALFGCSVSNDSSSTPVVPNCLSKGAVTVVGTNHGHTSTSIPIADISTAIQKQYTVGDAGIGHTHTFTVAAANFTTLQGNTSVILNTDGDGTGHFHQIVINCS